MAVDPGTALQVGAAVTKFAFGIFGGGSARRRARFELESQLEALSLEEQALALEYAKTFTQGQEIELQSSFNEWQSEFQLKRLEEETRQRNIDRAIAKEYTVAGLEREETVAIGRLDYARASELKARESWAVREGLLEQQYAVNIGLINEREALQVGQIERTKIRHDAQLVVQAAASNLINRQLPNIRADQASVYDSEIDLVQSSARHARSQEAFGIRMKKLDADERLAAFEMNKDLAIAEYQAARKHAARVGRIQTYSDQELTNLGAWRGKLGDIIGQPEGPNLFFERDPGAYDENDENDDNDIVLDPDDVNTPGVDPGTDDGQDKDEGRLDEVLDELEDETIEKIEEIVDTQESVKDSALYRRYQDAVRYVQRATLRYGPQRLSGAFGRRVNEAIAAERALMLGLGLDTLPEDIVQETGNWKGTTLQVLQEAAQSGKKGWRKSNLDVIANLQAQGVTATSQWWTDAGIVSEAQRLTESSHYSSFISGDYTDAGLGARGRLERSAGQGAQPTQPTQPAQPQGQYNFQYSAPQFDSSAQGQQGRFYSSVDGLQNSEAGRPEAQVGGQPLINNDPTQNPPTGAGGSFAIGADGEAVPFVGAFDPSNEQRQGGLSPNGEALPDLYRRWGLRGGGF